MSPVQLPGLQVAEASTPEVLEIDAAPKAPKHPRLDKCFAALSDPTRRRLLEHLRTGDQTVSQLAEPLPMSLPAVQKHLRVLEQAGLVVTEKRGRARHCHLNADPMTMVVDYLGNYQDFWHGEE